MRHKRYVSFSSSIFLRNHAPIEKYALITKVRLLTRVYGTY